jgi:hypothetical protein
MALTINNGNASRNEVEIDRDHRKRLKHSQSVLLQELHRLKSEFGTRELLWGLWQLELEDNQRDLPAELMKTIAACDITAGSHNHVPIAAVREAAALPSRVFDDTLRTLYDRRVIVLHEPPQYYRLDQIENASAFRYGSKRYLYVSRTDTQYRNQLPAAAQRAVYEQLQPEPAPEQQANDVEISVSDRP